MATQILRTDHLIAVACPADNSGNNDRGGSKERNAEEGNLFVGFFFAMLFDVILVILSAAMWEFWRHIR